MLSVSIHQHLIIECLIDSVHDLDSIAVSGLNADQLGRLTNEFQLEKIFDCAFKLRKRNTAMADILNYLSNMLGFEVFSATVTKDKHFFYLKKLKYN